MAVCYCGCCQRLANSHVFGYGKVDLGYSYLYVRDPEINMTKNSTTLRGSYDAGAHIVGLQYSVGF